MSVTIRKLLSRKFNIVCLNLAGLLTCVLPSTFPFAGGGQWFSKKMAAIPLKSGTKLTVAGTVPEFLKYEVRNVKLEVLHRKLLIPESHISYF